MGIKRLQILRTLQKKCYLLSSGPFFSEKIKRSLLFILCLSGSLAPKEGRMTLSDVKNEILGIFYPLCVKLCHFCK